MKICLLILLLVTSTVYCKKINSAEYFQAGFNLKRGTFEKQIFNFSYNDGNTFKDYDVPDGIAVTPVQFVQEIACSGIHNTYFSYVKETQSWNTFDIGFKSGAFSAGLQWREEMKTAYNAIVIKNKTLANGYQVRNWYSASMDIDDIKYTNKFNKALNDLPKIIQSQEDFDEYQKFFDKWGTHFISRAYFGARVDVNAFVDQKYMYTHTWEQTTSDFSAYFAVSIWNISSGGHDNTSITTVNEDFLKNTNSNTTFYGGDMDYASLKTIEEWVRTIKGNEYPFNMTLIDYSKLVNDKVKAQTMYKFITDYINSNTKQIKFVEKSVPYLGYGFDPLTLTATQPIFEINYSSDIISNPFPFTQLGNYSDVMISEFSGKTWYYEYHHSNGFLGFGSKTTEIKKTYELFLRRQKSLAKKWITIGFEQLTLPIYFNRSRLTQKFINDVNNLTHEFDFEMYQKFINKYGYAIVDQIVTGGKYMIDLTFESKLMKSHTEEWIRKQSEWSFMGIMGGGHGESYHVDQLSSEFVANSNYEFKYFGGDIGFKENQWKDWMNTVYNNPYPIEMRLQNITSVIPDSRIRMNIDKAYNMMATQAVKDLDDYKKSLST